MTKAIINNLTTKTIDYMIWKLKSYQQLLQKNQLPTSKINPQENPIYNDYFECYQDNWKQARCVFCLSTGRVGTMTLSYLLSRSPDISSCHEPEPRLIHASLEARKDFSCLKEANKDAITKWKEICLYARDDYVFRAALNGKIYAEMSNYMTYLSWGLKAAFPGSKFIHLHRHPIEFIISALNRNYFTENSYGPNKKDTMPSSQDPYYKIWHSMSQAEKCAWLWHRTNEDIMHFTSTLSKSDFISIRSEEIFNGNELTIKSIFNFLQTTQPKKSQIKKIISERLNRQTNRPFEELRAALRKEEIDKVTEIVNQTAKKLGYEL